MRAILDTNVVLRYLLDDDAGQAATARKLVRQAKRLVIPVPVLCEVAWILLRHLKIDSAKVADAIDALTKSPKVETERTVVAAGIDFLRAGGDFADGAIAQEGSDMGGNVFVTFDRQAATLHTKLLKGAAVKLLL
ncbi:MAG: type II toxin-antitoxin system VapC family toxin [Dokdonella sp.]|uniref:type II toxin-antitoxin system VapC family toxin n=1 Tax=Dokdonella sp. TaxID=2291710 RepID=UPI0025C03A2B|nr:type II toxin-antitoxin system VapC family toxin [Dokdonella sp.]MBZ0222418.1 type II toxin-antitoxin system VapC family toxin [Dokdonella sp.]MCC7255020.1 type II toxin-antitoxin system VapC family toxin [Dokdonella sp.]